MYTLVLLCMNRCLRLCVLVRRFDPCRWRHRDADVTLSRSLFASQHKAPCLFSGSFCEAVVRDCLWKPLFLFLPPLKHPLDSEAPFCPFSCQSGCIVLCCRRGDFVLALSESLHLGDTRTWEDWRQIGRALCVAVSKHLAWCDMKAHWRLKRQPIPNTAHRTVSKRRVTLWINHLNTDFNRRKHKVLGF